MKRALLLPLLLAGCQTVTPEARMAQDDAKCLSYGVPRGSQPYVQCRMQLDQNRANIAASEKFATGGQRSLSSMLRGDTE
jgi:hypothetical protein